MDVQTTRFGPLAIDADEAIDFPSGPIGLEGERRWVLLADAGHQAIGWLQSLQTPALALPVVDPRRFVPGYRVRVSRRAIEPLGTVDPADVQVLVTVSRSERGLTLNLKAPLVIDVAGRRGTQVIANDDHPIQYPLTEHVQSLRKSA